MPFDPSLHPHRRFNPLTGGWVVVSPQRTQRPWDGQVGDPAPPAPPYDPDCYLCPGNERAGGVRNPHYDSTFVFANDFAALLPDTPGPITPGPVTPGHVTPGHVTPGHVTPGPVTPAADPSDELVRIDAAAGECRVICFSPRHDLALAQMDHDEMSVVVDLWRTQLAELGERYEWVQIFETRGAISGASNPHPHGQIWASAFLPDVAALELDRQRRHHATHGTRLLVDYARREVESAERIVAINDHWVVVVPHWAYWPFETLVLPRRPVSSLAGLNADECDALADILPTMLRAFDRVFDTPFPYCSGWHSAPRSDHDAWQLHAHYYPPLLRSADVAKIPASYELLANLQRDLTPEVAAARLREVL